MLQSDSVFSQNLTVLYKCSEVVLLRSSQEILCVLLVNVSTSSEDKNLRLLCSHAINDIQDASVGLGLQVIGLQFKEDTEYNFIRGSIEKTAVLLKIIKILDFQATEPICSLGSIVLSSFRAALLEAEQNQRSSTGGSVISVLGTVNEGRSKSEKSENCFLENRWTELYRVLLPRELTDSSFIPVDRASLTVPRTASSSTDCEVVLLRSSQEILCVLLVDVSTSSEDRNLRLVCSHAINDIQEASVGLGLQVIRLQFKEGTEYNFITGSIEKTTVLLKIIKILDSQATQPIGSLGSIVLSSFRAPLLEVGTFVTLGTIERIDTERGWQYLSCKYHNKKVMPTTKVDADNRPLFFCNTCDKEHIDVISRFKLIAHVKDDSGEANFLLFDANAQQIIEDEDFLPEAVNDLFGKRVLFEISVDADNIKGKSSQYVVRLATDDREMVEEFADLPPKPVLMLESADDISSGSGGFSGTPLSKRKSQQDEDSCLEDQHSVNKKLSQKKLKGE
ncbi:hypothetical protein F2Q70_00037943 [Brassica cretica]|uniref:Replication factor A C-terminal domain-containing protein n=1 Tax=Brassica cretica TaxID=69181 RepID=A0A8S9K8H5_BRACR|nr:hypothetical protein F2Q70_00037943 [Brassica cretica]